MADGINKCNGTLDMDFAPVISEIPNGIALGTIGLLFLVVGHAGSNTAEKEDSLFLFVMNKVIGSFTAFLVFYVIVSVPTTLARESEPMPYNRLELQVRAAHRFAHVEFKSGVSVLVACLAGAIVRIRIGCMPSLKGVGNFVVVFIIACSWLVLQTQPECVLFSRNRWTTDHDAGCRLLCNPDNRFLVEAVFSKMKLGAAIGLASAAYAVCVKKRFAAIPAILLIVYFPFGGFLIMNSHWEQDFDGRNKSAYLTESVVVSAHCIAYTVALMGIAAAVGAHLDVDKVTLVTHPAAIGLAGFMVGLNVMSFVPSKLSGPRSDFRCQDFSTDIVALSDDFQVANSPHHSMELVFVFALFSAVGAAAAFGRYSELRSIASRDRSQYALLEA